MIKRLLLFSVAAILLLTWIPAQAQDANNYPVYIIQKGDTLNTIASKFGISANDIIAANGIQNPDILVVGTQLVIPGLEGVKGILTTKTVALGESMPALSRLYQVSTTQLARLNRITSPSELFAGSNLIIPQPETAQQLMGFQFSSGQSLLEAALIKNRSEWELSQANQLNEPWSALPNEIYYTQSDQATNSISPISPSINTISISPLPLVQGETTEIKIATSQPVELIGTLNGKKLNFFALETNQYVAIQGIYAMAPPGLAPISLHGKFADGSTFQLDQLLLLSSGFYSQDPPLYVDPETIDPAVTKPEDELVRSKTEPVTPVRMWDGIFRVPVDEPACIKSSYGNRRAYNGGDYIYFHTGVDYGTCASLNIYAPAAGIVVYTGLLTVRGNSTIIDHGWGIYSGIYHQSKIIVNVGDKVEAGQLIGEIGKTGRVTGPHLHWDLWVGGIQSQPLTWLETVFP